MINIQQAKELVESELSKETMPCGILENKTIEREWGWVFFYQSKSYIETEDFRQMLGGNAPFIVNRETSKIIIAGTAHPIEYYIQEYESSL
jgi:hypothetical protein